MALDLEAQLGWAAASRSPSVVTAVLVTVSAQVPGLRISWQCARGRRGCHCVNRHFLLRKEHVASVFASLPQAGKQASQPARGSFTGPCASPSSWWPGDVPVTRASTPPPRPSCRWRWALAAQAQCSLCPTALTHHHGPCRGLGRGGAGGRGGDGARSRKRLRVVLSPAGGALVTPTSKFL